jgi:hypothetical protein
MAAISAVWRRRWPIGAVDLLACTGSMTAPVSRPGDVAFAD